VLEAIELPLHHRDGKPEGAGDLARISLFELLEIEQHLLHRRVTDQAFEHRRSSSTSKRVDITLN